MSTFIHSIRLRNILSFGPETETFPLEPLNVLIGPNASGKSNFLEIFKLLKSTPRSITEAIAEGGGIAEWLWKGSDTSPKAEIELVMDYPDGPVGLRYRLEFKEENQRFDLMVEALEGLDFPKSYFLYNYKAGEANAEAISRNSGKLFPIIIKKQQSILSQLKDPIQYPEITYAGTQFGRIQCYQDWRWGRKTPLRQPQSTDLMEDVLQDDFANLPIVLNDLMSQPEFKRMIQKHLGNLYDAVEDVGVRIRGGTAMIFVHEKHLKQPILSNRLSDGTLRFLCLLAILGHPTPPPLICLEEPDLGLHPDLVHLLAEMMIDAASRTQLIVTTHSHFLISALGDQPQSVVVCENHGYGTEMKRLDPDKLKDWLKDYTLGNLWMSGELGGTRW
jgi:predicted ATPase